jgi:hypothetical protein
MLSRRDGGRERPYRVTQDVVAHAQKHASVHIVYGETLVIQPHPDQAQPRDHVSLTPLRRVSLQAWESVRLSRVVRSERMGRGRWYVVDGALVVAGGGTRPVTQRTPCNMQRTTCGGTRRRV